MTKYRVIVNYNHLQSFSQCYSVGKLSQGYNIFHFKTYTETCSQQLRAVFQIVVEGVKAGPTQQGDMAFDDVRLTDAQCPPHGFCDFESSFCSWSNVGGGVDQEDWLHGTGASPNPTTGPAVDHTTNSPHGNRRLYNCN